MYSIYKAKRLKKKKLKCLNQKFLAVCHHQGLKFGDIRNNLFVQFEQTSYLVNIHIDVKVLRVK